MANNLAPVNHGASASQRWQMPSILGNNPLLNNRAIALISERSVNEIEVVEAEIGGGYVYETSKARLTFFNESSPHFVAGVLASWSASKRVVEIEFPECPDHDLLVRLFGVRYDVSKMQILSFKSVCKVRSAAVSAKVDLPSPQTIELIQGFHREALNSSISVDRTRALIEDSSRDFFELNADGRCVAVAALTRKVQQTRCFSFFYVAPRHRGQGFGAAIFSHALTEGLKSNREIFLHVDVANVSASRLYTRFTPAEIGTYLTAKVASSQ